MEALPNIAFIPSELHKLLKRSCAIVSLAILIPARLPTFPQKPLLLTLALNQLTKSCVFCLLKKLSISEALVNETNETLFKKFCVMGIAVLYLFINKVYYRWSPQG